MKVRTMELHEGRRTLIQIAPAQSGYDLVTWANGGDALSGGEVLLSPIVAWAFYAETDGICAYVTVEAVTLQGSESERNLGQNLKSMSEGIKLPDGRVSVGGAMVADINDFARLAVESTRQPITSRG